MFLEKSREAFEFGLALEDRHISRVGVHHFFFKKNILFNYLLFK
jgi:hypothetical protein